jgi:hypothetical protein
MKQGVYIVAIELFGRNCEEEICSRALGLMSGGTTASCRSWRLVCGRERDSESGRYSAVVDFARSELQFSTDYGVRVQEQLIII